MLQVILNTASSLYQIFEDCRGLTQAGFLRSSCHNAFMERKTSKVQAYCTERELERLTAAAALDHLPLHAWVLRTLHYEADRLEALQAVRAKRLERGLHAPGEHDDSE